MATLCDGSEAGGGGPFDARSGLMSVYFVNSEGSNSSSNIHMNNNGVPSFEMSFQVFACPFHCPKDQGLACDDRGRCVENASAVCDEEEESKNCGLSKEAGVEEQEREGGLAIPKLLSGGGGIEDDSLGRTGHTMVTSEDGGVVFLFGGRSQKYGPLNDIR